MKIDVELINVSHLPNIKCSIGSDNGSLMCIVGKNGVGKTTLFKALKNIKSADTFIKTSSDIFNQESRIIYRIDDVVYDFYYDENIKSLNSKKVFPTAIRDRMFVELPIPHGDRFNFFQKISEVDAQIRQAAAIENYNEPKQLISFLNGIYDTSKFNDLRAVSIKGSTYYFRLLPSGKYLREDYFSSGEYFLISLFRSVFSGNKFVLVDEIDISLDAAAQVRLVSWLRKFQKDFEATFVFSTHSLAMMKTMEDGEIFYMENSLDSGDILIKKVSFNYINSILFGFKGWGKFILTEDEVLADFIGQLINKYCSDIFHEYKIIHIGGATNTTDLLRRNREEGFFSTNKNVIAVLDGDQKDLKHARKSAIHCIPLWNLENAVLSEYLSGGLIFGSDVSDYIKDVKYLRGYLHHWRLQGKRGTSRVKESEYNECAKSFYKKLIKNKIISKEKIYDYLCEKYSVEMNVFMSGISKFLSAKLKINSSE